MGLKAIALFIAKLAQIVLVPKVEDK